MGRSAGTGSPVWFRCWQDRRRRYHDRDAQVRLTGRTRRYQPKRYSAMGIRSMPVAFEYECDCGHIGWSNHFDLARLAGIPHERMYDSYDRLLDAGLLDGDRIGGRDAES